jgi:endonuclease YncB( thermonuclease family)
MGSGVVIAHNAGKKGRTIPMIYATASRLFGIGLATSMRQTLTQPRIAAMTRLPAFLCALLAFISAVLAASLTGRASVIDGDTLAIHGRLIRLYGIDAPETAQTCSVNNRRYRCGEEAARALSEFIGERQVACDKRELDSDGRIVAVCHVGGEDMGAWMVLQGWALAHSQPSREYFDEELAARANKRGIWRGTFMSPWLWRRRWANAA